MEIFVLLSLTFSICFHCSIRFQRITLPIVWGTCNCPSDSSIQLSQKECRAAQGEVCEPVKHTKFNGYFLMIWFLFLFVLSFSFSITISFSLSFLFSFSVSLNVDRPACHLAIFQAWETFLQETETDSQACNDVASVLSRQVREHLYTVWLYVCVCVCVRVVDS